MGDEIAGAVLGAAPGQTVVADSTSVNLFKVLHAACNLRPDRDEIVVDTTNFPTDRYLVEGVAAQRGMTVRWLEPDLIDHVTADALAEALGERTAVVVLSHVDYRSGSILDVAGITAQVHAAGGLVVWDLCHSAGVLPLALDADDVDFAVGCTYKYLDAGPGAPAFLYVAARHLGDVTQPVPGWWSAADLFAMADTYTAAPDIRRMLSGTPNVMGILAVREGVRLVTEAGIDAIRAKSIALTDFLLELVDRLDVTVVSPRDSARRGSHITIQVPGAADVAKRLGAAGVIPDVRHPDLLRLGLSPLSTSFTEVLDGWAVLAGRPRLVGMTRVAVLGAQGRMGSTSVQAIGDADGLEVVAQVDIDDDLATITEAERRGRARLHPAGRRPRPRALVRRERCARRRRHVRFRRRPHRRGARAARRLAEGRRPRGAELLGRRGADDALRRHRCTVLRLRRGHRDAPSGQGRRPVRHRDPDR